MQVIGQSLTTSTMQYVHAGYAAAVYLGTDKETARFGGWSFLLIGIVLALLSRKKPIQVAISLVVSIVGIAYLYAAYTIPEPARASRNSARPSVQTKGSSSSTNTKSDIRRKEEPRRENTRPK